MSENLAEAFYDFRRSKGVLYLLGLASFLYCVCFCVLFAGGVVRRLNLGVFIGRVTPRSKLWFGCTFSFWVGLIMLRCSLWILLGLGSYIAFFSGRRWWETCGEWGLVISNLYWAYCTIWSMVEPNLQEFASLLGQSYHCILFCQRNFKFSTKKI